MKVDVEGNVYCTGPGGIWVMKPDGEHIGSIRGPWMVNMAWGEDDWSTLYFTGRNSLNKIKLNIPGIPVPRGAL
jgi:gluconolactonase